MDSQTSPKATRSYVPYVVLGLAVLVVSSAAIAIRFAQAEGVPSLAIAAWRLSIAAAILWPITLGTHAGEIRQWSREQWLLGALSGVFLALHFASWISSLAYTSVGSSLALVSTNPVWIALISWLAFREKPGRWLALGIAAAVAGSILIFFSDSQLTVVSGAENATMGNVLAITGSLTVCGYLLIGRRLRKTVSLLPYIWLVYSTAALVLVVMALAGGAAMWGYSNFAWLCLAGLALGPQLLGHSVFNWALKHVSATFIAVVILGEPIGSALLAWLIFNETFAPLQLAGFCLLLAGIYLASRAEKVS
ncbi:MAG: DMT family transporter [Betaproteobacteria bacterium]